MSRSRQTPESIQADFDRIALLSDGNWDHNAHYHGYLIDHIPERSGRILEIGCGTGEFSRLLAGRAESVLAMDLSTQMIRIALERSKLYPNIDFVEGDVMAYQFPYNEFDCIATLTTLHHLPLEFILRKIRKALKPGGVFVCLDLYRRSGLTDLLFDGVAYPATLFLGLIKTGKPRPPREVREAYAAHGKTDTYLTLPQIRRTCADILPGALVSRHLFWRYSIIWTKETCMNIILVCRAGLACMVLLAPIPVRAQSAHLAAAETGVHEACVSPGNGGMRLVGAGDVCHAKETRVRWNAAGPQRPAVPQGATRPPRRLPPVRRVPPHGGGRQPYVWVCTPAHFPNGGSNPRSDVYVFNGSSVTANVAINILDRAGKNLAGAIIPGTASTTYPGEVGAATVPLLPAHTRDLNWLMPATSGAPGLDGITNVAFTVRVTSDQPIVVGSNFQFAASMPNQCSLLPK